MPITDNEAADIAIEINEAIPAVIRFAKLPRDDKAKVIKSFADGLIGTDETALIESIPGLTPSITEGVTDAMLDVISGALAKYWDRSPPEE